MTQAIVNNFIAVNDPVRGHRRVVLVKLAPRYHTKLTHRAHLIACRNKRLFEKPSLAIEGK